MNKDKEEFMVALANFWTEHKFKVMAATFIALSAADVDTAFAAMMVSSIVLAFVEARTHHIMFIKRTKRDG